jgi:hypothetical protein
LISLQSLHRHMRKIETLTTYLRCPKFLLFVVGSKYHFYYQYSISLYYLLMFIGTILKWCVDMLFCKIFGPIYKLHGCKLKCGECMKVCLWRLFIVSLMTMLEVQWLGVFFRRSSVYYLLIGMFVL